MSMWVKSPICGSIDVPSYPFILYYIILYPFISHCPIHLHPIVSDFVPLHPSIYIYHAWFYPPVYIHLCCQNPLSSLVTLFSTSMNDWGFRGVYPTIPAHLLHIYAYLSIVDFILHFLTPLSQSMNGESLSTNWRRPCAAKGRHRVSNIAHLGLNQRRPSRSAGCGQMRSLGNYGHQGRVTASG